MYRTFFYDNVSRKGTIKICSQNERNRSKRIPTCLRVLPFMNTFNLQQTFFINIPPAEASGCILAEQKLDSAKFNFPKRFPNKTVGRGAIINWRARVGNASNARQTGKRQTRGRLYCFITAGIRFEAWWLTASQ